MVRLDFREYFLPLFYGCPYWSLRDLHCVIFCSFPETENMQYVISFSRFIMYIMQLYVTTVHFQLLWDRFFFSDTSVSEIEEAFKSFSSRDDIAIILINQTVSDRRISLTCNEM